MEIRKDRFEVKPRVTVKAVKTQNITGKELFYLKIEREDLEPYFVNVGLKTYNEVLRMENELPEPELPLGDEADDKPSLAQTVEKNGKKG